MRKLAIVSGSARIRAEPASPIPAIQRIDGLHERILRGYCPDLAGLDILILSPIVGLVSAKKKIGFEEPVPGSWHRFLLSKDDIFQLRKKNLRYLRNMFARRKYEEVYVNVGKEMMKMIEGFEVLLPNSTKITYAEGRGIGPKMSHMKNWLEMQICR